MSVNYAAKETKTSELGNDFAKSFVARQYGELAAAAIFAALPVYQRGKRKGQPKGWVVWTKCTKGGWVRSGPYDHDAGRGNGHVMQPGTHDVQIVFSNPNFTPDGQRYGLEAGQRRGVETDQEWADRCGKAIADMAAATKR